MTNQNTDALSPDTLKEISEFLFVSFKKYNLDLPFSPFRKIINGEMFLLSSPGRFRENTFEDVIHVSLPEWLNQKTFIEFIVKDKFDIIKSFGFDIKHRHDRWIGQESEPYDSSAGVSLGKDYYANDYFFVDVLGESRDPVLIKERLESIEKEKTMLLAILHNEKY